MTTGAVPPRPNGPIPVPTDIESWSDAYPVLVNMSLALHHLTVVIDAIAHRLGAVEKSRERQPSFPQLEHVTDRLEEVAEGLADASGAHGALNSERVRMVAKDVVIEREHAELVEAQKQQRAIRHQVVSAVLSAIIVGVLAYLWGRLSR